MTRKKSVGHSENLATELKFLYMLKERLHFPYYNNAWKYISYNEISYLPWMRFKKSARYAKTDCQLQVL